MLAKDLDFDDELWFLPCSLHAQDRGELAHGGMGLRRSAADTTSLLDLAAEPAGADAPVVRRVHDVLALVMTSSAKVDDSAGCLA